MYAAGSVRITISILDPALVARSAVRVVSRASSRSVRFSRLRRTAECPCLGTTKPIRLSSREVTATRTSSRAVRRRVPSRAIDCKSAPRVIRWRRVKRWVSLFDDESGAGVLGRELYGKSFSPLFAATAENFASPFRRHSLAETMRANASLVAGTICWLAHDNSGDAIVVVPADTRARPKCFAPSPRLARGAGARATRVRLPISLVASASERPVNVSGTLTLGQGVFQRPARAWPTPIHTNCNFPLAGLASLPL